MNNSILLIDPGFEPTNSQNYSLLIKIGADTFSYAIIDKDEKQVYAVYDEQECRNGYEKLEERLQHDAYLKLNYKAVKLAVHTENLIFVPKALFDEANVDVYTKYFSEPASQFVQVHQHTKQSFNAIFSFPIWLEDLINKHWENNEKIYQHIGLIALGEKTSSDTVFIDFTVKSFHLIYFKDKQLVFHRSYQFDDIEEFTYYLLLIINQLNIDTTKTHLQVCGIVHPDDEKWKVLAQYFKDVSLLTITSELDTHILDDMPAHYYTSLLALQ